jgi:ubiquitin
MKNNTFKIFALVLISLTLATSAKAVVQTESNDDKSKAVTGEPRKETVEAVKAEVTEKKVERVKTVADKQLDQRIEDLGKVVTRMQEMKNLTATDKNAILAVLNGLIGNLNNLKLEIENATSTDVIKQAREIISQNYRVYALVMPQLNIIAAADRMTTTVSMMFIVGAKLESRLGSIATSSEVTSVGIASAKKSLENMKDALVEAQRFSKEAIAIVSILVPDQGDKVVMDSNLVALKDGKAKIKSAQASLVSAKKSAEAVLKLISKEKPASKKISTTTPEVK